MKSLSSSRRHRPEGTARRNATETLRSTVAEARNTVGKPAKSQVVSREQLAPDVFSVRLRAPAIARAIQPGQFVQVRITGREGAGDLLPFLRRPLSVAQQQGGEVRLVFRVVGRGTGLLAATRPGDDWDVLGPLGKPAPAVRDRNVVLVGGGIGIAPLLFLAERTARDNRVHVLLGARNRQELILRTEFRKLPVRLAFATDDGSLGTKGFVTDTLRSVISNLQSAIAPVVFACGPRAMLRRVKELTKGLESYAFWEEHLGCGTGICYCCAVKRAGSDGYIRFCREGPVLRLSDIEL
jgi:dihydroorotate dehydrogenase electron transfer subunit